MPEINKDTSRGAVLFASRTYCNSAACARANWHLIVAGKQGSFGKSLEIRSQKAEGQNSRKVQYMLQ
jgi:hypothetical protein